MRTKAFELIKSMLASRDPDEVRRGLAKVREAAAAAPHDAHDAEALLEAAAALFYLDPLDRPEFAPVLDEAISVVAAFGPRFVPALLAHLDAGDVKAQIAVAHALGRMGRPVVAPLVAAYQAAVDTDKKSFILYALGKVPAPEVAAAAPLAIDGATSPDRELRDTATRAIGRMAAAIPPGKLTELTRRSLVAALTTNLADRSAAIRAKAVRSLGKLAEHGHLTAEEKTDLAEACRRIAGRDEAFDWDRAYVVRREAEEALERLAACASAGPPVTA